MPVGGVFLSRFLFSREPVDAEALYDPRGRYAGFDAPALVACALGALVHTLARDTGSTLPALATALLVDRLLLAATRRRAARDLSPSAVRSSRSPLPITSSEAPMSAATAAHRLP